MAPINSTTAGRAGISTGAAARLCGLSRHVLLRAARRGDLPIAWSTPGGRLRFSVSDVEVYAAGIEASRRESDERFRRAFSQAPNGMALAALDGRIVEVNQAVCRLLGYTEGELLRISLSDLAHPDDREESCDQLRRLLAGETQSIALEVRCLTNTGQVIWTHYTASLLRDADERRLYYVFHLQDITALKDAAEAALQESEHRFRMMVELAPVGACIMDEQGRFEAVNEAYAALFGYRRGDLIGKHFGILFGDAEEEHVRAAYAARMLTSDTLHQEHEMVTRDGESLTVLIDSIRISGHSRWASFVMDITARKRVEQRLAHAASHDALTGSANRLLFADHLEQALLLAERHAGQVAVLLIDLDGFKMVNDRYGHPAGDVLLRSVANRLQACVRSSDTTDARLGGDEFGVLLPEHGEDGALRVAAKINAALTEPVGLGDAWLHVGCSIGIAVFPMHGKDAETLTRHADAAMYAAKREGGGYLLAGEGRDSAQAAARDLSPDLWHAVSRGGLRLQYEPIVHCPTMHVVRAQAQVCWDHPRLGTIPHAQIMQVAKESGAGAALTFWVLEEAIRQCAEWRARGMKVGVAVKLNACAFEDSQLLDRVPSLLQRHGLPAAALTLETSENTLMCRPEQAIAALEDLARTGVRVSIGDYCGYSSVRQLRRLPLHEIKPDQSFLANAHDLPARTMLAYLIGLGMTLNLEVVVQGVESEATWHWLAALHCELVQGHFVGPSQPPEQFVRLLQDGTCKKSASRDADRSHRPPPGIDDRAVQSPR